jgi:DNA-binding HxlR family transcriptional regulator
MDNSDSECGSITASLKIIGDKWTGLLVRELTTGPKRFTALQEALPGISPRTLSQRLDRLEYCNIVSRKVFAEAPPRVEYSLTAKGEDLIPILQSMIDWGAKYPS